MKMLILPISSLRAKAALKRRTNLKPLPDNNKLLNSERDMGKIRKLFNVWKIAAPPDSGDTVISDPLGKNRASEICAVGMA